MRPRSLRTDVRNPILSLPSAKRLAELPGNPCGPA